MKSQLTLPQFLRNSVIEFEAVSLPNPNLGEETSFHYHVKDRQIATEATKITGKVLMNCDLLAAQFLDSEKWKELFPSIVQTCSMENLEWDEAEDRPEEERDLPGGPAVMVIAKKVKGHLRSLCPAIPVLKLNLYRVYKKLEDEIVLISDFSDFACGADPEKGLISGCRLEPVSDAETKVTFFFHRSYDISRVREDYRPLLRAAFNSGRWLATLKRECERRAIHGSFFSPVVTPCDEYEKHKLMVLAAKVMREKFSSFITVDDHYDVGRVKISNPHHNLFSALMSTKVKASHKKVFDICKESIMGEHGQGGVESKIPQSVENCVSVIISVTQRKFLFETYVDSSEALVVYAPQEEPDQVLLNPSGFSIQPDGDVESYLTFAVLAEMEAHEVDAWKVTVEEMIRKSVADIIGSSVSH